MSRIIKMPGLQYRDHPVWSVWNDVIRMVSVWTPFNSVIETVSQEGTFCDTVQVPSNGGDMELI